MEKIKVALVSIIGWAKGNRREFLGLALILVLACLLRLYRISEYMTFLGDEGRDVIVVRRLLVDFDPILIGPGTSIGNMYLGPLYYYLMAPSLLLANFSPVGPAVGIALLGVATVFFVWFVAREWFGSLAALLAALLYAVSPTVIIYSRSSWNPNIMPFFALVCIYLIWRVWHKGEYKWLPLLGISYAFVLQSHYLGLLLAPVLVTFWILSYLAANAKTYEVNEKSPVTSFTKKTAVGVLLFAFLMSPLFIFDARHGWRNFAAMKDFFTKRQETVSARPWSALPKIPAVAAKVSSRLIAGRDESAGKVVLAVVSIPSLLFILGRKRLHPHEASGFLILGVWLVLALVGLGLYKQEIYDHYYGFFFPAPFLLIGGFVEGVFENLSRLGKGFLVAALAFLLYLNFLENPLKYRPSRQLQRSIEISKKIADESKGERFNLAVVAERNYEDGYQYFLEKENLPVVDIDAQVPESVTDQLFVVCEMEKEKCDPTHSAKAEVANFGWSRVEKEWRIAGATLYLLVHTQ